MSRVDILIDSILNGGSPGTVIDKLVYKEDKSEKYKDSLFADTAYAEKTAEAVTKVVCYHVYDSLRTIMIDKTIGSHPSVNEYLIKKILTPRIRKYYLDAANRTMAGDQTAYIDWDSEDEFVREVLRPGLAEIFKKGPRFSGFGPMSYISRLKKIDPIPWVKEMSNWAKVARDMMSSFEGSRNVAQKAYVRMMSK